MAQRGPDHETTYSAGELAAMLGVKLGSFRNRYRALIPERCVRQRGRAQRFTPDAVAAIIESLVADARRGGGSAGGASGGGEDNRLQRIKADLADLTLRERRSELVAVSVVRRVLGIVADQFRRASERLEREYDANAASILDHALDDAEDAMVRAFPEDSVGDYAEDGA